MIARNVRCTFHLLTGTLWLLTELVDFFFRIR